MFRQQRGVPALAVTTLIVSAIFLPTACGDEEDGLSRAEVENIVRAEMAEATAPPQVEPGVVAQFEI